MTDLHTLLARIEKAEGPSRDLDGDIAEMFNPDGLKTEYIRSQARHFTASIDASLTLVERMLPGWSWTASQGDWLFIDPPRPRARATLTEDAKSKGPYINATAATPALALLAACLRALIAKDQDNE